MTYKILVIEDEPDIRDLLRYVLEQANMQLLEAENAQQAQLLLQVDLPDLILLDWMLPEKSGIHYLNELRKNEHTRDIPVILLTAKAEEDNKVKGLAAGADDYVTKPFSPRELIARIEAVLRRGQLMVNEGLVKFQQICIDTRSHQVTIGGNPVNLSPIEFKLLHFLLTHRSRVFSRDQLINHLWGSNHFIDQRSVDVQILRLRKLLKKHGVSDLIQTIHGMGYKCNDQAS